jgi:hypothetical protein
MVTSRSRPQHIAHIFSPSAGQNLFGGRFLQIGQLIQSPNCLFSPELKVSQGNGRPSNKLTVSGLE